MEDQTVDRVVYIEAALTPYRIPMFNEMNHRFGELRVYLLNHLRQPWSESLSRAEFKYSVLRDFPWVSARKPWSAGLGIKMLTQIENFHPAAIVISGYSAIPLLAVALYAKLSRIPVAMFSASHQASLNVKGSVVDSYRRLLIALTDAFVVPSQSAKSLLISLGARRDAVFWAPNAIDNEAFRQSANSASARARNLRKQLGLGNASVLLFVGRLSPEKGLDTLLQAFSDESLANRDDLALVVVGDGPLQSHLTLLAKQIGLQNVRFVGFVERNELPSYYAMADAFVLPSLRETWGMVVNEAMACGLPIIVSDVCGAANDVVKDGVNGYIVPAGDGIALTRSIGMILDNQSEMYRMGKNSLSIISRYTIGRAVDGFEEALNWALMNEKRVL